MKTLETEWHIVIKANMFFLFVLCVSSTIATYGVYQLHRREKT